MSEGIVVRKCETIEEFQTCVQLQREIWGMADIDLIPARSYAVQTHIGGLVLGAFDSDRLIGFVNATPGIREGIPRGHERRGGLPPRRVSGPECQGGVRECRPAASMR